MENKPVVVIGIGINGLAGLSREAREWIARADELWGGERLLALWAHHPARKVTIGKQLAQELQNLRQRGEDMQIVLLASGDPGFFGLEASLLKVLPSEELICCPQISILQAAFARIRVPWSDAAFTSAHARSAAEVIGLARRYPKLGILTDPEQTPPWIARKLLAAGIPDCRAVVLENLGAPEERVCDTRLVDLPDRKFGVLNVLLLIHDNGWKPRPAIAIRPDTAYDHLKGMITKADVRLMGASRLELRETDVIWDIGAGSGAVSIEMAEIAWRGRVYAIEKDLNNLDCLRSNMERFGVLNAEIIAGSAPEALSNLPAPDAVFIGGSGGRLEDILAKVETSASSGCRVAAHFTLLENLVQANRWMKAHGWQPSLTEVQFAYGKSIADGTHLLPENPVFILNGIVDKGTEI